MELTFLGTAAGVPTSSRNVSALIINPQNGSSELWLFDCGEGTQRQMLKTPYHPGKLSRIFITHLHGDHIFGLPGLLCSRSMAGATAPLTLYGPAGLREFVETTLRLSGSWTDYPLEIFEICEGIVCDLPAFRFFARELEHPVACFGYRIEQHPKPGKLDARALQAAGVMPWPIYHRLKQGQQVTLDDGSLIDGRYYLGPEIAGKVVVIFGDNAPSPNARLLAANADLIVHEATLEAAMAEKAACRGHSTSLQASMLAHEAQAQRLIITHISSRYDLNGSRHLLAECRALFPATELAADFSVFYL